MQTHINIFDSVHVISANAQTVLLNNLFCLFILVYMHAAIYCDANFI